MAIGSGVEVVLKMTPVQGSERVVATESVGSGGLRRIWEYTSTNLSWLDFRVSNRFISRFDSSVRPNLRYTSAVR